MIGQWCKIDKNRFCQEADCQGCQINYYGDGWLEYQPLGDLIHIYNVTGKQSRDVDLFVPVTHK